MADAHADRITAAIAAFKAANTALIAALDGVTHAERAPVDGGWTPAQIAWHVAESNLLTAGVLSGTLPGSRPAPQFVEDPEVFARIPAKVDVPFEALRPPITVSKDDAIAKLQTSETVTVRAIANLSPERGASHTVKMPYGILNLYQVAEFTSMHARRHEQQMNRANQLLSAGD
jgi:hypothetical protein